jgi:hypothetical protein
MSSSPPVAALDMIGLVTSGASHLLFFEVGRTSTRLHSWISKVKSGEKRGIVDGKGLSLVYDYVSRLLFRDNVSQWKD